MLNRLIDAALIIVLMAAAAGQLPRLVQTVRVAQLHLLKDSQSSKWGRPFLIPLQSYKSKKLAAATGRRLKY